MSCAVLCCAALLCNVLAALCDAVVPSRVRCGAGPCVAVGVGVRVRVDVNVNDIALERAAGREAESRRVLAGIEFD